MAGHSKWANIKRRKAVVDAKRSKVWTKVIKEIQVAARMGGGDPDANPRLRLAMDKARSANVPKDSIKRAIDKGSGGGGGDDWEDVVYEGYGPAGVAVLVECMTDNRNRTVGEVRHAFEKHGGNMGNAGSVAWLFKKRGIIHVLKENAGEERLMEVGLEAGAEDIRDDDEVWTIECDPADFLAVKEALEGAGIELANAEVDNVPDTRVELDEEKAESMFKMLGVLEDLDDVQNVYANYEIEDEILERLGQ
jgi:YebC/PmpR family DNA-binding regulatory protein